MQRRGEAGGEDTSPKLISGGKKLPSDYRSELISPDAPWHVEGVGLIPVLCSLL